jgi:hypothetical protein
MQFISLVNEEERFCWLQQDGVTSHTANSTMDILKQLICILSSVWYYHYEFDHSSSLSYTLCQGFNSNTS